MTHESGGLCVGIDGYPKGWVAVVLVGGRFDRTLVAPSLRSLVDLVPDSLVIGVDMPIGLPGVWPRVADVLAKRYVGPRRNSVFMTPPRRAVEATDLEEARRLSIELTGRSVTAQAWALRPKMLEADLVASNDPRVREVHPEVSFCTMAGEYLGHPKSTWAGLILRRRLLESQGIVLPDDAGPGEVAGFDDVLDAAAAAWSAARISAGTARSLPDDPQPGPDGHTPAIWY